MFEKWTIAPYLSESLTFIGVSWGGMQKWTWGLKGAQNLRAAPSHFSFWSQNWMPGHTSRHILGKAVPI